MAMLWQVIGQVSNKLKNRLEEMMVHGHQTPDETILSITERPQEVVANRDDDRLNDEQFLTPRLARKSERLIDEDTLSRITGIPEDGQSTPLGRGVHAKHDEEEVFMTPITKTMSQYRREEKQALQDRATNVQRIVYQIPSNMMQVSWRERVVLITRHTNTI